MKRRINIGVAPKKSQKGITLIALVITIIILIVLSAIVINLSIGNNGIFNKAKEAKIENKKSQISEYLDLKLVEEKTMDFGADNKRVVEKTRENVIRNKKQLNRLGKEIEIKEVEEDNKEVFFYVIVDKDIYKVSLSGTKYIGKQSDKDIELQTGDIIFLFTPSEDTKGNVKVGIQAKKEIEGYKIEYKTAKSEWTTYRKEIEVDKNQDIYARLSGIIGNTTVATGTVKNIDKLPPNEFTPEVIETTSNSIKVKAETTDAEADEGNICSGEIKYLFSKDGGTTWDKAEWQESGEYEFTGLEQTKTYTIKVKAKDKVGNEVEAQTTATTKTVTGIQTGDVIFTYTPSEDTKQNVQVEITGNTTEYTLQYKTEKTGETGEVSNWTNYTGAITITRNQDIYVRTVDSRGQTSGTYATGTVKNIDKLPPNEFTLQVIETTSNSIKIKAETTDAEADEDNICSGEIKYLFSKDGGTTWDKAEWQESGEYEFSRLEQTKTYAIKVKAKDKVGNEVEAQTTATTKTVTGIQTGDVIFSYSTSEWTNGNVQVEITGNTTGYILQYKTEKTGETGEVADWTNYTGAITITRNQDIYARTVDSRGQTSGTYATGTVANIDKTAPSKTTVNLNGYTSGTWTNGNVTQSFTATDSESGVSYYQYSHDGVNVAANISNPWTIDWDGQWNFYVRAVDNAGNPGAWSDMYTIKRDATAPAASKFYVTNITTSGFTLVMEGISDSLSGVKKADFVNYTNSTQGTDCNWPNGATISSGKATTTISGLGQGVTVKYGCYVQDDAGNRKYYDAINITTGTKKVTGIGLNKTSTTINVGSTETLTATISPSDAYNKNVIWSSNNTGVATVSNGVITAKAPGTATITVAAQDGSGKSATCSVTVRQLVTGVNLNKTSTTIYTGKTETLTATVSPSNASNKNITWSSNNTGVATVSNGVVTAKAPGTAKITATAQDGSGKSASCTVTVENQTLYLYNKGDECTSVTGGFTLKNTYATGPKKNADNIYCYAYPKSYGNGSGAYIVTNNKIDITNYTKLCMDVNVSKISGVYKTTTRCYTGVYAAKTSGSTTANESIYSTGRVVVTVDISSLSGSYYIRAGTAGGYYYNASNVLTGGKCEAYIYKIWLE